MLSCANGFVGCAAEKLKTDEDGGLKLKFGVPAVMLFPDLLMPSTGASLFTDGPAWPPNAPKPPPPLPKPPNDLLALMFPTVGTPFVGGNDWFAGLPKEKIFPDGVGFGWGAGAAPKLNDGLGLKALAVVAGAELPDVPARRRLGVFILSQNG